MAEDIIEIFAFINRDFKSEEVKLRDCPSLKNYDVKSLSGKVENLSLQLSMALGSLSFQMQSAGKAAGAVNNFYETFVLKFGESDSLQNGFHESENPQKDLQKAETRYKKVEELQELAKLASTAQKAAEIFEEVVNALQESELQVQKAKQRVVDMKDNLEDAKRQQEDDKKRLQKEEEDRRAEEVRQKQMEQDLKRKEELRIAKEQEKKLMKKMSSEEREKYKKMEEEKDAIKRDPRSWPKYLYTCSEGEFEHQVCCVLRAYSGSLSGTNDLRAKVLPLESVDFSSLSANEEIVGNVVQFEPAGLREEEFNFSFPWALAVPHCAQRNNARETVLFVLQEDGSWLEVPSSEVHIDLEEVEVPIKFVELRTTTPFVTCVPVNKVKTDRFQIGKKGGRIASTVDTRVTVTYPPGAIKVTLDQCLQVQPIDATLLNQLKEKNPKNASGLLTISPMIEYNSTKKKALRPVNVTFPLPLNPAAGGKKIRPGTAVTPGDRGQVFDHGRPKTAAGGSGNTREEDDGNEIIQFLGKVGKNHSTWRLLTNYELEEQKNKDIVAFDMHFIENIKFIAMRTKEKVTEETLVKLCEQLEDMFLDRSAVFLLRQHAEDLANIQICVTPSLRLDRAVRLMSDQGYTFENSMNSSSSEIKVKERQKFTMKYRGNIQSDSGENEMIILFNSQLKNKIISRVCEVDKFAQRAIDQYRGFAQLFTIEETHRHSTKEEIKKGAPAVQKEVKEVSVCDLLISIPKVEDESITKTVKRTDFDFRSNDAVTKEFLLDLAREVKDYWEFLAERLGIKKMRCSAIKRVAGDREDQAYDMLITWVQRQPTSVNKAIILSNALYHTGHLDLAENLRDMEKDLQTARRNGVNNDSLPKEKSDN